MTKPSLVLRPMIALLAALLLGACAQTRIVDSWETDQQVNAQPGKVAVFAMLPEALARKAYEIDVARVLDQRGVPAVPASSLPGLSGGIRGEIDTEIATGLLRKAGVDGIVVMFYAGGGNSEGYVRSDYWLQHVGSGFGYNWGRPYFTGGMTHVYTVRQGPGWADYRQNAYVESSYYDMETEEPIWRIVTFTKDIEHTDGMMDIARMIASEMKSAGLN